MLAPDRWTEVTIESVERLTGDTSLFKIKVPRSVLPDVFKSDPDAQPILSLFVKEPTLQIQRAYTVRRSKRRISSVQANSSLFPT